MNPNLICRTMIGNALKGRYWLLSFEEAIRQTRRWCKRFPVAYDLVIGIPRTGLTIAGLIADELALPISALGYFPGIWRCLPKPSGPFKNILIVEDSTAKGSQLMEAKCLVQHLFPDAKIHIGALIVPPTITIPLDTYGIKANGRCIVEWELMHIEYARNVAMDLDGVICQDYPGFATKEENRKWFENVPPYKVPVYGISAIITSREEEYREITIDWLCRNGIRCPRLMMDPLIGDKRDPIGWKVDCINKVMPDLFIESADSVAKAIHHQTGVPTICIDTMRIYA